MIYIQEQEVVCLSYHETIGIIQHASKNKHIGLNRDRPTLFFNPSCIILFTASERKNEFIFHVSKVIECGILKKVYFPKINVGPMCVGITQTVEKKNPNGTVSLKYKTKS